MAIMPTTEMSLVARATSRVFFPRLGATIRTFAPRRSLSHSARIAMLSSVLKSKRAVQVNIQIMRTFTKLRELLASNELLRKKIEELEKKYDQQFQVVFEAIKKVIAPDPPKPKRQIGFHVGGNKNEPIH
jgi:hypothetical protein